MSNSAPVQNPREDLAAFYRRLIGLMTTSVSKDAGAELEPTLYPKGAPPSVLVYAGSPDARELKAVRDQLPAQSFLFYLYPPCAGDQESILQQGIPDGHRTIACPMTTDSFFADKIGTLVAAGFERNVRLIVGRGYEERFANEVGRVKKAIEAAQENMSQDLYRGLIRLRCSVWNLPAIWKSRRFRLRRSDGSVPAVVCGAGPSLAGQIPMLKNLGSKAVLIAVGHAVPTMVRAGITPHIVVESDSMAFRNWPDDMRVDSVLVAGTDVSPSIAARFERTQWFHGSSYPFTVALAKSGIAILSLHIGRTVTISAVDLAVRLGFRNIALVGQDLCVGKEGLSHVDGERIAPGDLLVSVPGNEDKTVSATACLLALKRAIEDYVRDVTAGNAGLRIVNCTEGGALIEGALRGRFDQWCEEVSSREHSSDLLVEEIPGEAAWSGQVKSLADGMDGYAAMADKIVQVCRRLNRNLADSTSDFIRIRNDQARLQGLMIREQEARAGEMIAEWPNTILHYTDEIMRQTPGMIREDADPVAQLRFLESRFRLAGGLCAELATDLRAVRSQLLQMEGETGKKHARPCDLINAPYVFRSFRRHAVAVVRCGGNETLATYLEAHPSGDERGEFRVTWMNQVVPYVEIRKGNGGKGDAAWHPLSGFLSMYSDAVRDIRDLERRSGFDPSRHGLVLVCPGNWIYAFAFGKAFPSAEAIIVEPWLDLFSRLIERGCFLYPLSPGALIVAADERVGDWRAVCAGRLGEWKRSGKEPVFFVPPACRAVQGIPELENQIRSLC